MECDGLVDEDCGPRDFLIDLWPYARPARFSSSMTSLSAMIQCFSFFISFGHSESHPARVFSGSASALAIGFGNIQWSGFYQSLLEDVMQVAGLQQLAILSTSGHPACVIAGRKIQADPRSLQLNKLCFWV